jgi:hypothetical protein
MAKDQTDNAQTAIEDFEKLQIATRNAELAAETAFRNKLLNIYTEAAQHKEMISRNWKQYTDFLRGRQWPSRRPSHKVSAIVNFMIENVERKTALLTDTKPIPEVRPRSDKLQDTADILNTLISMIFESSTFSQARVDLVENAQTFGLGAMGTLYDSDADAGRGEIVVSSFDPRAVYFDPMVRKSYLLHEGEYVILEDVWSLSKAKDIFPKRADMYKPDAGLSRFKMEEQNKGFFQQMRSSIMRPRQQDVAKSEIPRVYIREYYIRDRSKNERNQYRFNHASRKVVMIGDVIAMDGDNPYNDGTFPLDTITWHTDFHSGWGWGDVELLESPQKLLNKIAATIMENIALMSNAIWVGDEDALKKEEWRRLNNAPGTYVKKRPGRELRREPGVPLPTYVNQTLGWLGASSEQITGMVDVVRGIATGQVSSGVGVESLQMMAQALIRLRARAIESMQERIGRKLISRIFQYYEPAKIFEVLKEVTKTGEDELKAFDSELVKPISKRREDAWTDIAFKIEPGSSLGLAKSQRRIESMRLYEMKAIDGEALLEDLEYPHRTQVLKRMNEKREVEETQETAMGGSNAATRFPQQQGASPIGRT